MLPDSLNLKHLSQIIYIGVISVGKDCWLTVRVSEKMAQIVRTTADLMGLSVSELLQQAILESWSE